MPTIRWTYHLDSIHWDLAVSEAGEVGICLGPHNLDAPTSLRLTEDEWLTLYGAFLGDAARTLIDRDGWLVAVVNGAPFGLRWLGVKAPGGQSMVLTEAEWRSAAEMALHEMAQRRDPGILHFGLGEYANTDTDPHLLPLRDRS